MSPILFPIYIDVLIIRLKASGYGCQLIDEYFGCLLYAEDIMLLIIIIVFTVSNALHAQDLC